MPIVFLTLPGNFIVAMLLTQTFGLGEAIFGLIVSLPAWCNVLQLFLVPVLSRRYSQKAVTLAFSWLHLGAWLAMGIALTMIPRDDPATAGGAFLLLFGLAAGFQAVVGVSWTSWVQEWVPGRVRGKYFGRRNRLLQLSTVLFLLAGGEILTRSHARDSVLGFQIIIAASVVLRLGSIFAQHRILGTTVTSSVDARLDLRSQLRLIAQNQPLLALFAFGAVFGFATSLFGPFFNVFLYEALHLTVAEVSMLFVISSVTGAIALPAWGQFLDRYGNRPTMYIALVAWMVPGFCWALLTPANTWILKILYASGGVFSAGFVLGQFNLLLKLVPPAAKTAAISLNVAATSLASAIGPIIGGLLLDRAWDLGFDRLPVYHSMAVVHHFIIIVAGLMVLRIAEPKSSPLSQVVGAMRSSRQIFALLGMSFLVNYVFTKSGDDAEAG